MTGTEGRAGRDARDVAAEPWPLVGRSAELTVLCAALREGASFVAVTGTAGIGKSRLTREALAILSGEGVATEWALATSEARTVSLGALGPWLTGGSGLPLEGPMVPALALRQELERRHPSERVVLVVDDAHRLDDESAELVARLATAGGLSILLTVRSDDPVPQVLANLLGSGGGVVIELRPLGHAEVERMVPEVLGAPVDSISLRRLWQRSDGNPLWLRELVIEGLGSGRLVHQDGRWSWLISGSEGQDRTTPGARLQDLLRARLDGVAPALARALELVALSEPLPVPLATAALGADVVAELATTGIAVIGDGNGDATVLRLSHPLFGEILRSAVPPLRARNHWRTLADALEATAGQVQVPLRRRAWWYLEAELPIPTGIVQAAAMDALDHMDPALAERLARAGLAEGASGDLDVTLVDALSRLGRWDEVMAELRRLEPVALDGNLSAQLAMVKLWPYLFMGDLAAADAFLAEAASGASNTELIDAATTHQAVVALFRGEVERCHEIAWGLHDHPDLDDFSRRWSLRAVVNADALAGRSDLAIATSEKELARAGVGSDLALAPEELMVGYCLALWRGGYLVQAHDIADRYHRSSVALGDPSLSALTLMLLGIAELEQGMVERARQTLDDARSAMARSRPLYYLPYVLAELARAASLLGDEDAAVAAIRTIATDPLAPFPVFESAIDRGRAWVEVAGGRPAAGIELLVDAASVARERGQSAQQALLLHDVARLGQPERVADELAALATRCDGVLVGTWAHHAAALVSGDAGALELVAEELDTAGDLLGAAEAWAEVALALRAKGRIREAERCGARSTRRLARSGPVRSPALSRSVWEERRLTPREVEVATLARQGRTNREIAALVDCSVRTVENHLGRVYLKLAITGRDELPDSLL